MVCWSYGSNSASPHCFHLGLADAKAAKRAETRRACRSPGLRASSGRSFTMRPPAPQGERGLPPSVTVGGRLLHSLHALLILTESAAE